MIYHCRLSDLIDLCGDYLTDLYHALTWPQLSYVAEDHKGRIVGYILAKMCVLLIYPAGVTVTHFWI